MVLEERAFSGRGFRPFPESFVDKNLGMFAIVSSWGPSAGQGGKKILDFLKNNCEDFSSTEKTKNWPWLKSLSDEENSLRSLLLSCNEWIFNEWNKGKGMSFACELVCGCVREGKLIFIQVGHPFIYLDRPGLSLQPLGHILDLSGLFAQKGKRLPPLPSRLMGLYPDNHFSVFSLPILAQDRLLFISRDFVPGALLDLSDEKRSLSHLLSVLTEEDEESPCWLGILEMN